MDCAVMTPALDTLDAVTAPLDVSQLEDSAPPLTEADVTAPATDNEPACSVAVTLTVLTTSAPLTCIVLPVLPTDTLDDWAPMLTKPAAAPVPASMFKSPP